LLDGKIVRAGETIKCAKLFDSLAVDWMGGDTTEYKEVSVALTIRAVKPASKTAGIAEEAAKKAPMNTSDIGGALANQGDPDTTNQAISVIEIGDI
jgi:hypothetical protein